MYESPPPPRYGRDGRRSRVSPSPYHDRNLYPRHGNRNNKKPRYQNDEPSSDDEELKGLTYFEYRRLKRQKLRKKLKHCISRVTPSPPRTHWDQSDDEEPLPAQIEEEKKKKKKEDDDYKKEKKKEEELSSGFDDSESDSESSHDSRANRKDRRRKRRGRSRWKRRFE